jgi:molybdopterin converting factor small subunit
MVHLLLNPKSAHHHRISGPILCPRQFFSGRGADPGLIWGGISGYIVGQIMKISVKSYHDLKTLTAGLPQGGQMELVPGDTVRTVLTRLAVSSQKLPALVLFVNGRMARLETPLQPGDTLTFFSPLTGG